VKDAAEKNGNGFVFQDYTVQGMLEAARRAEEGFYRRDEWADLMRYNMKLDFSWKASAVKYEEIYLRARKISQTHEA
jgi:starch synthase